MKTLLNLEFIEEMEQNLREFIENSDVDKEYLVEKIGNYKEFPIYKRKNVSMKKKHKIYVVMNVVDEIIYVGKTSNSKLKNRLAVHTSKGTEVGKLFIENEPENVVILIIDSVEDDNLANELEGIYIYLMKNYLELYNVSTGETNEIRTFVEDIHLGKLHKPEKITIYESELIEILNSGTAREQNVMFQFYKRYKTNRKGNYFYFPNNEMKIEKYVVNIYHEKSKTYEELKEKGLILELNRNKDDEGQLDNNMECYIENLYKLPTMRKEGKIILKDIPVELFNKMEYVELIFNSIPLIELKKYFNEGTFRRYKNKSEEISRRKRFED